jgi:hypothetical protein
MSAISSEPSSDSRWCCGVAGGISGQNERVGEAGGEFAGGVGGWGDAGGLRNVMGWLGLGVRQFGLSECLGRLCRGSLCGGGSLRTSWDHGTRRWDLWGVSPSLQRVGGTYRGGPGCTAHVVAKRARRVSVT